MSGMTKEEVIALVAKNKRSVVEAEKQLRRIEEKEQEAGQKLLNSIVGSIEDLLYEARDIANKYHLEFEVNADSMYLEFDPCEDGNWNTSSC